MRYVEHWYTIPVRCRSSLWRHLHWSESIRQGVFLALIVRLLTQAHTRFRLADSRIRRGPGTPGLDHKFSVCVDCTSRTYDRSALRSGCCSKLSVVGLWVSVPFELFFVSGFPPKWTATRENVHAETEPIAHCNTREKLETRTNGKRRKRARREANQPTN